MKINADWHLKNKMPKNATAAQRLTWHLEHAKNCSCREMAGEFLEKLKARVVKGKK